MPATSGFAEINGARLYYEIDGLGPEVVLVHAGICDSRMWDAQWEAFSEHYRVLRYDMRGFGRSEPVDNAYTHHRDLEALLGFLNIPSAALVGCSKGGGVCASLAVDRPDLLWALAMVCSDPPGFEPEPAPAPPPRWDELVKAFEAGDLERAAELEVQIWVVGRARTPEQVDPRIRERVREMDLVALRNEKRGLGTEEQPEPPAFQRLAAIEAPVLALLGEYDDPFFVLAAEELKRRLPRTRSETIAGAAHLPNMERPDEFNRLVLEFLTQRRNELKL